MEHQKSHLDLLEAVAIHGGSISWWRKAIKSGKFGYSKRGNKIVFRREELEKYFASRYVPAAGETGRDVAVFSHQVTD